MQIPHHLKQFFRLLSFVLAVMLQGSPVHAWHDRTHMAVVEAAGAPRLAYLAVGADMVKEKWGTERLNHYSDNPAGTTVTTRMVLDQVPFYNTDEPSSGHLYGAIVSALDTYRERRQDLTKYALYPLGFAMHYIGDLSMPLHNMTYNDFNRANHAMNDGVVDQERNLVNEIRARMGKYPIVIDRTRFRESLASQVAQIATRSTALGFHLQAKGLPVMSPATAYEQLAQSAALLRAVLIALCLPVEP